MAGDGPSLAEHAASFDAVAELLQSSAQVHAYAFSRHRGTSAESAVTARLEQALDRVAVLQRRGPDLLTTAEIIDVAIDFELRLAHELEGIRGAAEARTRAQLLVDAARRGRRLQVRGLHTPEIRRGIYLTPARPEVVGMLHASHEPYLGWRDGIVVILHEATIAELRAEGDRVEVLFLDPDELLDLAARADDTLEAELDHRLALAQAAPDRCGDSHNRHVRRLLMRQTVVLRHLRDRLAAEHPVAHTRLLAVLETHRETLWSALAAAPPPRSAAADPLAASTEATRAVDEALARAAEDTDPAGFGTLFRAAAATPGGGQASW